MRCFVVGFTDIRSAFFLTSNVPKPCIEIIFPSSNCLVISDSNEATSSEVSFNVYPNLCDNSEVNSLLQTTLNYNLNTTDVGNKVKVTGKNGAPSLETTATSITKQADTSALYTIEVVYKGAGGLVSEVTVTKK